MMLKFRLLFTLAALISFSSIYSKTEKFYIVEMKTNKGEIILKLSNRTPLHRDNFVKLCKEKFYDNVLFHRVIEGFMIQAGDPQSKSHSMDITLGDGELPYKVDAEIVPGMFHKRGVLAAAREGDSFNPERKSSSTHFYIVTGKVCTDADLNKAAARIAKANRLTEYTFPDDIVKVYKSEGGAPHLDTQYTIFGEVIKGMDVVMSISKSETDNNDRPLENIVIISAKARLVKKYR